jgi:hypothetical protein
MSPERQHRVHTARRDAQHALDRATELLAAARLGFVPAYRALSAGYAVECAEATLLAAEQRAERGL